MSNRERAHDRRKITPLLVLTVVLDIAAISVLGTYMFETDQSLESFTPYALTALALAAGAYTASWFRNRVYFENRGIKFGPFPFGVSKEQTD